MHLMISASNELTLAGIASFGFVTCLITVAATGIIRITKKGFAK